MRIEQNTWMQASGWQPGKLGGLGEAAQLVLAFGASALLKDREYTGAIRAAYPSAHTFGCSTAGEIASTQVHDDSLVVTAIQFEHTRVQGACINLREVQNHTGEPSFLIGQHLARALPHSDLVHVLVLSDGLNVNGSELVAGLTEHLPSTVTITGGLSGDADRFQETLVFWDGKATSNTVVALGLYGTRLRVGFGSLGGWDPFGPERLITRSNRNVLYELDGRSALELYKMYLGEYANGLPASGLLFPLSLRTKEGATPVVRTILSVNEAEQSMTFAGNVPKGAYARLMKANFDRLIDGALGAARTSYQAIGSTSPDLALLISCVGRKLILKQRIEEEVEAVRDILGDHTALNGFYSYGEISPFTPGAQCELHNQTMTITTFAEV
jgi:hypothetical protein